MKTFFPKTLLFLFASLIVVACDKDDDPVSGTAPMPQVEKHPVEAAFEGTYWQDKICFTYIKDSRDGNKIEVSNDIDYEYFGPDGGSHYSMRLGTFSVESDTRKIRVYDESMTYIGSHYYHNRYKIEYPDQTHVRIKAMDELDAYVGASFNTDLEVISCTDKEIVLDGPVKPYIREKWCLEKAADYYDIIYLGIRVFLTKIENGSELLEPSSPLD